MTADEIIRNQRSISVVINMILSGVFFVLVFGFSARVLSFGTPDRLAFDFVPQGLAIGFFSALVPTLIVAAKRQKSDIAGIARCDANTKAILLRAIGFALMAAVIGGVVATASVMSGGEMGFFTALAMKMIFGAALGWLITPRAVSIVLRKD